MSRTNLIVCHAAITPEQLPKLSAGVFKTIPGAVVDKPELHASLTSMLVRSATLVKAAGISVIRDSSMDKHFLAAVKQAADTAQVPFKLADCEFPISQSAQVGLVSCIDRRIVPIVDDTRMKNWRDRNRWHITLPGSGGIMLDGQSQDYVRAQVAYLSRLGMNEFVLVKNQNPIVIARSGHEEKNREEAYKLRRKTAVKVFALLRHVAKNAQQTFGFIDSSKDVIVFEDMNPVPLPVAA